MNNNYYFLPRLNLSTMSNSLNNDINQLTHLTILFNDSDIVHQSETVKPTESIISYQIVEIQPITCCELCYNESEYSNSGIHFKCCSNKCNECKQICIHCLCKWIISEFNSYYELFELYYKYDKCIKEIKCPFCRKQNIIIELYKNNILKQILFKTWKIEFDKQNERFTHKVFDVINEI